jgi:sirohydrochlorin ferrochelatase
VSSFTTPGGHRRYRRAAIERMIAAREASARPLLLRSGLSVSRMAREYRQAARRARTDLPWHQTLTPEQIEWFRVHGRRLAESLLAHVETAARASTDHSGSSLVEATAEAAEYGRMASGLGLSLGQTVEGFLQFRRPFLRQLGLFANQRGLEAQATTDLVEAAEGALDRLLIATMAGHNVERVGRKNGHGSDESVETEGLR